MGSLSFGEIMTILLVILIVFGPDRLPELARRAGELVAKIRDATSIVTDQLGQEYGDEMKTVKELQDQVRGIKKDVTGVLTSFVALDGDPTSPNGGKTREETPADGSGKDDAETGETRRPFDDGPLTTFEDDGPLTVFELEDRGEDPPSP